METLAGKALNDIANLVSEKWYAGIGLIGLIIFMTVLLRGAVYDPIITAAIGATMIGFGFGESETRTYREHINRQEGFVIRTPARKFTIPGIVLYAIGTLGIILATIRAMAIYG